MAFVADEDEAGRGGVGQGDGLSSQVVEGSFEVEFGARESVIAEGGGESQGVCRDEILAFDGAKFYAALEHEEALRSQGVMQGFVGVGDEPDVSFGSHVERSLLVDP